MAAPTANVQHSPAHHDAVSQSLTSNTKFEQLTEQFAREMDVTNIKLHGTKERIEFLDRVKTVVQLKALLNDLGLLQVGGRLRFKLSSHIRSRMATANLLVGEAIHCKRR